MTAHHDLDQQLTDFLRDGPTELPYESFDAVRARTETAGQRVVVGPWRLPEMNKIVTIGLAAAAVVAAVFIGAQVLGPRSGGIGFQPAESSLPTATPEPSATPTPSPPAPTAPPLSQSFTSTLHGISLSYPEGWTAQPATEPWADGTFPLEFGQPHADWLSDTIRTDHLFLAVASQPIGDSSPEDWVAEQMASDEGCTSTEPITVDDGVGLVGADECHVAVVATAARGYWIQLYTGDGAPAEYDRTWFEEVLATVQLHPEDAAEAGSSPSP